MQTIKVDMCPEKARELGCVVKGCRTPAKVTLYFNVHEFQQIAISLCLIHALECHRELCYTLTADNIK